MKLEAGHIYKDKNNHLRLVLAVNGIIANYAYIYRTNIYEDIQDANISILPDDDYYVCIDRVIPGYISDILKDDLEDIEIISRNDFNKVVFAINQYLLGQIVMCDDKFMYKEDCNKRLRTVVFRESSDSEIKRQDPIKINELLEDTRNSDKIKLAFNGGVWDDAENLDNYEKCIEVNPSDAPDIEKLKNILNRAEKYNIRFNYGDTVYSGYTGEPMFNLLSHNINHKGTTYGKASKPRKISKDSARHLRNVNDWWFTASQIIEISNMSSAKQVADRYRVSASEGYIIYSTARRLMGYDIPAGRNVKYIYTHYFNNGYSVDEVYDIYEGLIDKSNIKMQYDIWKVNENGGNNKFIMEKWENILNSGDVDILIETYFDNTHLSFAQREKCTMSCASDIMNKIYNILCKNPFVVAGFGAISFDREKLMEYAADAINGNKLTDIITANLYEMTNQLYDVYTETYDNHSIILTNDKYIPESIKDNPTHIDCFKSLIWNRFNHDYMTSKRVLSYAQTEAIENGTSKEIALLFMAKYESVCSIKKSYYDIKKKKDKKKIIDSVLEKEGL